MENSDSQKPVVASLEPVQVQTAEAVHQNNSTDAGKTGEPAAAAGKNEATSNDTKSDQDGKTADDEKPKPDKEPPVPPKPPASTTLISCANCNSKIQEIEVQRGRDVEVDRLLNEALMTPFTMEVCDDEMSEKITATVEISVFEALVELFALRSKSPHLIPLLEKVMKKNSIENANSLGLGLHEPGKQMKLLSLCMDCTDRIANLYELYKEFTLLSMKSNSFFSQILGSSNSGSFAKTNIKTVPVPVPKSVQQARDNAGSRNAAIIPEVIIEDDIEEESMDHSANQTYSDNEDDSLPYSMEVETVYGESPIKITNSRGRVVTDHSSKGSGMFNDAAGPGYRRSDTKYTCKKCDKVYLYTTSFEKHEQSCTGPDLRIGSVTGNSKSMYNSYEEAEEISVVPEIEFDDSNYSNSGSTSYTSQITMYKCRYCNKACQSTSALQKHERTHGQSVGSSASSSSTMCKPCGRSFGSVYDLRRHYQTNAHKQRIREGGIPPKTNSSDSWNYSY